VADRAQVDVGVVTWNTAELTARAVRHLLDSEQGCELRVLVHDNHSSDATVEALARLAPEAEVEVSPDNVGFARGMNRLLHRSEAPWFFALNSDAWPEEGAIGRLLEAADRAPQAAAVAPLLRRPQGAIEHSVHPFPSLSVALLDVVGGRRWLPRRLQASLSLEGATDYHHARPVDWAVGAALLMRAEAVRAIGGFDERFFMYVEDLEWCWRADRGGWQIVFEPAAVVRHVGNASGERRFGASRPALEIANLYRFLGTTRRPMSIGAMRALYATAAAERYLAARIGHRPHEAAYWKVVARAHLGRELPPATGPMP